MDNWEKDLDTLLALREQSIDATATINRYFGVYPGEVNKEVLDAWQVVYEWMLDMGE